MFLFDLCTVQVQDGKELCRVHFLMTDALLIDIPSEIWNGQKCYRMGIHRWYMILRQALDGQVGHANKCLKQVLKNKRMKTRMTWFKLASF